MTVLLAAAWTAAASAQQSREPDSATADAAPVIALESGISLEGPPATTMVVTLAGLADAKLAAPPNCAPVDPASFAGFLRIGQMESAGTYEFTLSSAAWIDVIQDGRAIAPIGIDRAAQCLAGRQSVRYELTASPVVLQLTGAATDRIAITVSQIPLQTASLDSPAAHPAGARTPVDDAASGSTPAGMSFEHQTVGKAASKPIGQESKETAASTRATVVQTLSAATSPEAKRENLVSPRDARRLPELPIRDIAPGQTHAPDETSSEPPRPIELYERVRSAAPATVEKSPRSSALSTLSRSAAPPPRPTRPQAPSSSMVAASAPAEVPTSPPGEQHENQPAERSPSGAQAALPPAGSPPPPPGDLIGTLMRRGDELLKLRDIAAARLLYERAAMSGNAHAAMLAGKTYDPLYFVEIGASGIVADRAKALEWYSAAIALGDGEAAVRTELLRASSQ